MWLKATLKDAVLFPSVETDDNRSLRLKGFIACDDYLLQLAFSQRFKTNYNRVRL